MPKTEPHIGRRSNERGRQKPRGIEDRQSAIHEIGFIIGIGFTVRNGIENLVRIGRDGREGRELIIADHMQRSLVTHAHEEAR